VAPGHLLSVAKTPNIKATGFVDDIGFRAMLQGKSAVGAKSAAVSVPPANA
jgi:hypothetical protein